MLAARDDAADDARAQARRLPQARQGRSRPACPAFLQSAPGGRAAEPARRSRAGWSTASRRRRPGRSSTGSGRPTSAPAWSAPARTSARSAKPPSPSRAARLAGRRVHGQRLEPEGPAPADRHSATYRQSSRVTPELLARDPYNRLLARGPRFRVEAEVVRDIALAASGLLEPEGRRPERLPARPGVPVPAAGQLRPEGLDRGERARPLSPGALHVPLPLGALPDAADVRRPQRRLRLRPPRPLEHAAAGADDAERAGLPGVRPGPGAADAAAKAATPTPSGSRYAFRRCLARTPTRAESKPSCSALLQRADRAVRRRPAPTPGSWPPASPTKPPTLPDGRDARPAGRAGRPCPACC